jgi:hypothetical protein
MGTNRSLSAAMQTMAQADVVQPLVLVEALFDSNAPTSYLYLWNGIGELTHDSKTYIGAGNLLSISSIQENVELKAAGVTVMLSGVGSPLLSKAQTEDYQGRELIIRLGGFDSNGSVISDPIIVFSGFMDTMTISDGGDTATIAVTVENKLVEFEKTKVRRYTDNDQRILHPTDKGLEFVSQIQEKEIVWGDSNANPITYDTQQGRPIPNFHP